jgi:predicted protein tyrosine phosphatase
LAALVSIFSNPNSRLGTFTRTDPVVGFGTFVGPKIALCFDDASVGAVHVYPPTESDIRAFLNWAEEISYPGDGKILFHCQAGVGRSTACAVAFLTSHLGPGSEEDAMGYVAAARPQAWPNDLVIHWADVLLERDGALTEAVQNWKDASKSGKIYGW